MIYYADQLLERLKKIQKDGKDLRLLQIVVLTDDSVYRNGFTLDEAEDDSGEQVLLLEPEDS